MGFVSKIFGGGGGSSSGGSSTTTSNPWAAAQPYLKDVMQQAQNQFQKTGGTNEQFVNKNTPALTSEMQQAINSGMTNTQLQDLATQMQQISSTGTGTTNQATGLLSNLATSGVTANDINEQAGQLYQGGIVQNQIQQAQDAAKEQLANAENQINQGATSTGNMGSSRAGIAEALAERKVSSDLQNTVSNIQNQARQEAYGLASQNLQQNRANQLSATGQLGQIGQNEQAMLGNTGNLYQTAIQNQLTSAGFTQQQAQAEADTNYFNRYGQQNQGWENLGQYAGLVSGMGGMGGTSTGTQSAPKTSTFNNILGAASSIAGIAGLFSDASLKENVKRVGTDQDGNARYEWDWNKEGEKLGLKGKGSGVLAQQVAKTTPEAVGRDQASGKLKVDYSKVGGLSKAMKKK